MGGGGSFYTMLIDKHVYFLYAQTRDYSGSNCTSITFDLYLYLIYDTPLQTWTEGILDIYHNMKGGGGHRCF